MLKQTLKKPYRSLLKNLDYYYCKLVFGRVLRRYINFEMFMRRKYTGGHVELLTALPSDNLSNLLRLLRKSNSQLGQDLFVLSELNFKEKGFFIEFGATNGVDLSNSYILEKEFGWNGILAEPAQCWHKTLQMNRNCHIETNCVWKDSNSVLTFNEVDIAEFSTIAIYNSTDPHGQIRKNGKTYKVNTISLMDLLDKYNSPHEIDYLSIDTEGSEFEILKNFDFDKYKFRVITCEHNRTEARDQIHALLSKKGYIRKFESLSEIEDWYVNNN